MANIFWASSLIPAQNGSHLKSPCFNTKIFYNNLGARLWEPPTTLQNKGLGVIYKGTWSVSKHHRDDYFSTGYLLIGFRKIFFLYLINSISILLNCHFGAVWKTMARSVHVPCKKTSTLIVIRNIWQRQVVNRILNGGGWWFLLIFPDVP